MIPAIDEILRSSEMGGKTQMGDKHGCGGIKNGWGTNVTARAFNKYEIFEYLLY